MLKRTTETKHNRIRCAWPAWLALAVSLALVCLVAVCAFAPKTAIADEPIVDRTVDGELLNSYRYKDGVLVSSQDGANTDGFSLDDAAASLASAEYNSELGVYLFNDFDQFSNGYYTGTDAWCGVDVSHHNGTVDWAALKAHGVDFAIIRCGYGDNYTSQDDRNFFENVRNCKANGIPFGIYIYSHASSEAHAVSEKNHVLRLLDEAGLQPSDLAYPIYYDLEDRDVDLDHVAYYSKIFCDAMEAAGYEAGIYASLSWFKDYLTDPIFDTWYKWVAQWNINYGLTYSGFADFRNSGGIWQFSDYGYFGNVSTGDHKRFDLNYTYLGDIIVDRSVTVHGMTKNETGSGLAPDVTVKVRGSVLREGRDYQLLFDDSTTKPSAPGSYHCVVQGIGAYEGQSDLGTFTILPLPSFGTSGSFILENAALTSDTLIADAAGVTPKAGSNLLLWTPNGGGNQCFTFARGNDGLYTISLFTNSNLVLDANGTHPGEGDNVSLWTSNGGANQKWALRELSDGSYEIINAYNANLVLDAFGNTTEAGNNIGLWQSKNGANQHWFLRDRKNLDFASAEVSVPFRHVTGSPIGSGVRVLVNGTYVEDGTWSLLYAPVGSSSWSSTPPSALGDYKVAAVGSGEYSGQVEAEGVFSIIEQPDLPDAESVAIRSRSNPAFTLDAAYNPPSDGSNVSVWVANGGENQLWQFDLIADEGCYAIRNAADPNLVLDAAGSSPASGANVVTWTDKDGLNQRWLILPADDGGFHLISAYDNDLVLDAAGETPVVGANVSVWTDNGGTNQTWDFVAANENQVDLDSDIVYRLASDFDTSFVLDAAYNPPSSGSNVAIWTDNGGENQSFTFEKVGAYYVIRSVANPNLVLDAAYNPPKRGANVGMWTYNGGANQKWVVVPLDGTESGRFLIASAANPSLVLDAVGTSPEIGANVLLWTYNGGANQTWHLNAQE